MDVKPIDILGDRAARVEIDGDCWRWTGAKIKGFGVTVIKGKQYQAHRLAWMASHPGERLGRKYLHHSCGNKDCCNPQHLSTT